MGEWLGMPKALRTENSKAIVKSWKAGAPTTLADAFALYKGGRTTRADKELIARARGGDQAAMLDLWTQFMSSAVEFNGTDQRGGSISDPEVRKKLEYARTLKPFERNTEYSVINADLEEMVNIYKGTILYAGQKPASLEAQQTVDLGGQVVITVKLPTSIDTALVVDSQGGASLAGVGESENESDYENDQVQIQWQSLADTIRGSAERIWRDLFLDSTADLKKAVPQDTLRRITRTSQLLMLLWLETVLYQDRAISNYSGHRMEHAKGESTRKSIRDHVKVYRSTLKKWDKELKRLMSGYKVKTYFRTHRLESQQFRRLIRQFGDLNAEELGWASQASDAEAELRYQQRDELRREYRAEKNWAGYIGMEALRWTTGYGTKPSYFAITTFTVWGIDALAFWLNDYFHYGFQSAQHFCAQSQPHLHQWQDYILEGLRYFYIAITNLTSLGINTSLATYCGGAISEIAVLATTLLGYFMLGLLSAVLYTQLTQRD